MFFYLQAMKSAYFAQIHLMITADSWLTGRSLIGGGGEVLSYNK